MYDSALPVLNQGTRRAPRCSIRHRLTSVAHTAAHNEVWWLHPVESEPKAMRSKPVRAPRPVSGKGSFGNHLRRARAQLSASMVPSRRRRQQLLATRSTSPAQHGRPSRQASPHSRVRRARRGSAARALCALPVARAHHDRGAVRRAGPVLKVPRDARDGGRDKLGFELGHVGGRQAHAAFCR